MFSRDNYPPVKKIKLKKSAMKHLKKVSKTVYYSGLYISYKVDFHEKLENSGFRT